MGAPEIVGALIGIGMLTLINLVAIAYSYGRMTEKVSRLCTRMERVERKLWNGG